MESELLDSLELKSFFRSLFRDALLVRDKLFKWDVIVVLRGLRMVFFELLVFCKLKYFILKIVFLVALVTAVRVSELYVFSVVSGFVKIREDKSEMRFLFF